MTSARSEKEVPMNIIEQTKNGVTFFQSDGMDAAGGAAHGFSTRKGGV